MRIGGLLAIAGATALLSGCVTPVPFAGTPLLTSDVPPDSTPAFVSDPVDLEHPLPDETATTLRLYLYEDGDSVGTDGGSNDYVEWSPTQTGEKTISVNAAALDADGTTSQIVAVWVIQSGDPPVAYVRQCRVTSDVYLLPH